MQLMAGVKCCTGRRLTNHPHFEEKTQRVATKEVKLFILIILWLVKKTN